MIEKNDLISRYFHLEESIKRSANRIKQVRYLMYNTSLHTHIEPGENGELVVKAFRLEREVVNFVDCCRDIQRHIDMERKRMHYFKQFLNSLEPKEYDYLYDKYVKNLYVPDRIDTEKAVIDEINEIEEATMYMFGYDPDVKEMLPEETKNLGLSDIFSILGL